MVGRLVQDQKRCRLKQYLEKCKARPFTSGENRSLLLDVIPGEQERSQCISDCTLGSIGTDLGEDGPVHIKGIGGILGIIADLDSRSQTSDSGEIGILLGYDPEQSTLSDSVMTGDGHSLFRHGLHM